MNEFIKTKVIDYNHKSINDIIIKRNTITGIISLPEGIVQNHPDAKTAIKFDYSEEMSLSPESFEFWEKSLMKPKKRKVDL